MTGATDFGILIVAATVLALVAYRFGQPLIIAYIAAGVLVGDVGLGLIGDPGYLRSLTQIALAFLLFATGLELSLKDLKVVRGVVTIGTILETIIIGGIGFAVVRLLGYTAWEAAYLGLVLAFASTALVVKVLRERGELNSIAGRILVGTLVMQDVVLVVGLSALSIFSGNPPATLLTEALNVLGLAVLVPFAPLLGAVVLLGVTLLARRVLARVLFGVFGRSNEFLIVSALGLLFGLSVLADQLGFSVAIGAFLAGIVVANTEHASEIGAVLAAPTTLFIMFFFATLGFVLTVNSIVAFLVPLAVLLAISFIVRPLIVAVVVRCYGYSPRTALTVGLSMTSVPVLALVLIDSGTSLGLVREELVTLTVLWILISIFISSYTNPAVFGWVDRLARVFPSLRRDEGKARAAVRPEPHLLVLDASSFSGDELRAAQAAWGSVFVIDSRVQEVERMRTLGIPASLGKANLDRVMSGIAVRKLKLVVSGSSSITTNLRLLAAVRSWNKSVPIVLSAAHLREARELRRAGATHVVTSDHIRLSALHSVATARESTIVARRSAHREALVGRISTERGIDAFTTIRALRKRPPRNTSHT